MDRRQFEEWASSPLTKAAFQSLRDQRRDLMDRWAEGECLSPAAQTKAKLLGELSSLKFEDWFPEEDQSPD